MHSLPTAAAGARLRPNAEQPDELVSSKENFRPALAAAAQKPVFSVKGEATKT